MVVDTCCQEFTERERERESCRSGLILPVTEGKFRSSSANWSRREMLACSHQSPFQEDHCCLLFLPPSLPSFFLFFYSKILNCNSTQNIYNCSLSFHATSNPWMPSARKFSGLRFCFKLHLKWSPFAKVTSEIRHAPTQNKLLSFAPERLGYVALNLLNSPSQ